MHVYQQKTGTPVQGRLRDPETEPLDWYGWHVWEALTPVCGCCGKIDMTQATSMLMFTRVGNKHGAAHGVVGVKIGRTALIPN